MRYAYAVTAALLLGGTALTLTSNQPVGAQTAQNEGAKAAAPRGAPASFADMVENLQPAVVNISTKQSVKVNNPLAGTPFGELFGFGGSGEPQTRQAQSLGSGFIISADGYVVTNNHVVSGGTQGAVVDSITVIMPDRTEYDAKLIGRDPASDLAVLKVEAPRALPFVKFGDSTRARVGDWVIAIGNPFGLGSTVTAGIVSALHRTTGMGAYDRFIQTDASINQGNSGGPMFDMNGDVIGINSQILSPSGGNVGIGFAIPSEQAVSIIQTLQRGDSVKRGYLGVQISALSEDMADSLGLAKNRGEFVQSVEPAKGADNAGIKPGDVIVKVSGVEVTPDDTLSFIVANQPIGARVPIELIRSGRRMTVTAVIGERPSEDELANFNKPEEDFSDQDQQSTQQASQQALGVAVTPLTPTIARQVGVPVDTRGLAITAVDPGSDAATKGLRRGDVIMSANRAVTTTEAELDAAVRAARGQNRSAVLLQVQRRGQSPSFIAVRLRDN